MKNYIRYYIVSIVLNDLSFSAGVDYLFAYACDIFFRFSSRAALNTKIHKCY